MLRFASSPCWISFEPLLGGFEKWKSIAKVISSEIQITVSDMLKKDEHEDGCDIVDVIQFYCQFIAIKGSYIA